MEAEREQWWNARRKWMFRAPNNTIGSAWRQPKLGLMQPDPRLSIHNEIVSRESLSFPLIELYLTLIRGALQPPSGQMTN